MHKGKGEVSQMFLLNFNVHLKNKFSGSVVRKNNKLLFSSKTKTKNKKNKHIARVHSNSNSAGMIS